MRRYRFLFVEKGRVSPQSIPIRGLMFDHNNFAKEPLASCVN
jgi:hypothetical protein